METQLRKIEVVPLTEESLDWFVNVAAVNMLKDEVKRPELINLGALQALAERGMSEGTAFVAMSSEVPVGALGGLLVNNIYNPDILTLCEMFWYVVPEYRNTRAGALLFKAFDEKAAWCADESTLSILPSSIINIKTLEKRGFHLEELGFRKTYKV